MQLIWDFASKQTLSLFLSVDSKSNNWTQCTLNSQPRVAVAYIHEHTYTMHIRHIVHPHINLRVAVSPGGLASLLTVVVYTYKHNKTLVCTCIQKLKPPTPTCWKWNLAQSETRAKLSEKHTRTARGSLWCGLAVCLWEFNLREKASDTNKGLSGCWDQFNVSLLVLVRHVGVYEFSGSII